MLNADFDIYKRRSQEIVMVLYALRELGSIRSKQEVLRYIRNHRFYEMLPEDKESYESRSEWKADTLLCWGRKDAVMADLQWLTPHDEHDSWQINRDGQAALEQIIGNFRKKTWKIHRCYMWRAEFKRLIDPSYERSYKDRARPHSRRDTRLDDLVDELLGD